MDDVIAVVDAAVDRLTGLTGVCAGVAGDLREKAGALVAGIGEGSSSDLPGRVTGDTEKAAAAVETAAGMLAAAKEELSAYRARL